MVGTGRGWGVLSCDQHWPPPPNPPPPPPGGGGEGRGVGGPFLRSTLPPTPTPPPPLRGGRGTRGARGEGCPTAWRVSDSSTSVGKNPASVLPAPVGAISSAERPARAKRSSSS